MSPSESMFKSYILMGMQNQTCSTNEGELGYQIKLYTYVITYKIIYMKLYKYIHIKYIYTKKSNWKATMLSK